MGITLANNAHTTLSADASSTDTVIYVDDIDSFPTLDVDDYFYLTLERTSGAQEIVKVTQINAASFNVVRGQESTIPISFPIGSRAELRVTVQSLEDQFDDAVESHIENTAYGPGWDGATTTTASKNAVYDKLATVDTSLADKASLTAINTFSTKQNIVYSTGPLTFPGSGPTEDYAFSVRNSATTANQLYHSIFPDVEHFDAVQGVTLLSGGSDIVHATGAAGYVSADVAVTGVLGPNAVALFGLARTTVADSAAWGLNTLQQDSTTRAVSSVTGMTLSNELDFNVMSPHTRLNGLALGGNSLSQPTSADGFIVNPLGTGLHWISAFTSMNGAAQYGMSLGALATSGTNVDSQPLLLQYFNGAGTQKYAQLFAETNNVSLTNNDSSLSFTVGGSVIASSSVTGSTFEFAGTTDTTLSRSAAGRLAVEGNDVVLSGVSQTVAGAKTWSGRGTFTANNSTIFNRASFSTFLLELQDNGTLRGYIGADSTNAFHASGSTGTSLFTVDNSGGNLGAIGIQHILIGTAIPAGGTAGSGYRLSSASNFGVFFGSGTPSLSAAKGSLYLRSDGSTVNDRMYVNTDGSTTWTAVVTVA